MLREARRWIFLQKRRSCQLRFTDLPPRWYSWVAMPAEVCCEYFWILFEIWHRPICQIGVLTRKRCREDPKRLCGPTFDVYHAERDLVSKWHETQHFGAFWPVSLKGFPFPPHTQHKVSEKDIQYFYSAKCSKMALLGPNNMHRFRVKTRIWQMVITCFMHMRGGCTCVKMEPFVLLAFFPQFYSLFRFKIGRFPFKT